jgi:ribosomal-protein-alanine N-acetyltransferase
MLIISKTPRVIIRQFNNDEEHLMLDLQKDGRVTEFTTPYTIKEIKGLFIKTLADYKTNYRFGRWAIINRHDNDFIGSCTLAQTRPDMALMELGYTLHHKYWGQGIATEVVQALLKHGFDVAGLNDIYAITVKEHIPSQRVLIKCGFEPLRDVFAFDRYFTLFVNHKAKK